MLATFGLLQAAEPLRQTASREVEGAQGVIEAPDGRIADQPSPPCGDVAKVVFVLLGEAQRERFV